jgi:tripartite-type tricarboxylate transporter receptor subunit TctC
MAPAGTPENIVGKIAAEIGHAVKDPQFAARLDEYGVDPLGNTPAEFRAMVTADTDLWAETVQSLGLKF